MKLFCIKLGQFVEGGSCGHGFKENLILYCFFVLEGVDVGSE